MIKSPVELIVGTIRLLNIPTEDKNKNIIQLVKYGTRLGQDIFNPPNVKGWPGGESWITSDTLLFRQQLLQRITRGNEIFSKTYQLEHPDTLPSQKIISIWVEDSTNPADIEKITNYLLPVNTVKPLPQILNRMIFVRAAVLDPVYQLK